MRGENKVKKITTVKVKAFATEISLVVDFEHEPAERETAHCPGTPEQVTVLAVCRRGNKEDAPNVDSPNIINLLTDQELDILEIAIRRELAAEQRASSDPFINPGHKETP